MCRTHKRYPRYPSRHAWPPPPPLFFPPKKIGGGGEGEVTNSLVFWGCGNAGLGGLVWGLFFVWEIFGKWGFLTLSNAPFFFRGAGLSRPPAPPAFRPRYKMIEIWGCWADIHAPFFNPLFFRMCISPTFLFLPAITPYSHHPLCHSIRSTSLPFPLCVQSCRRRA